MEPKKKAEELVKKFLYEFKGTWSDGVDIRLSKQCALIAVEEIMKVAPIDKYENLQSELTPDEVGLYLFQEYWQEVKQELEKL